MTQGSNPGRQRGAPQEEKRNVIAFRSIADDELDGLVSDLTSFKSEMSQSANSGSVTSQDKEQMKSLRDQVSGRLLQLNEKPLVDGELE